MVRHYVLFKGDTVEYRIEHIDRLVADIIEGWRDDDVVLSEEDCAKILHESLEERSKICASIIQQIFKFTKEKEIELFIKNYQSALTNLLDRLYQHQQQITSPTSSHSDFYESFYQNILYILSFIEERFSKYFDKDEKVPDVYLSLIRQEIKGKLDILKEIVLSPEVDPGIFKKIFDTLLSFIEKRQERAVTYKDVMYLKELIKELQDIRSWSIESNLYSGFDQLLIYLNYNDKEYINYMVNRFAHEISTHEDLNDKIDWLLLYSKTLNQLQIKPDCALHLRHPSVKVQLSNWLSEELYYIEKKLGLLKIPLPTGIKEPSVNESKVLCNLSVDQLGIFFRAAADIQVISTPSQRALFEKITPYLSTPYKKTISADSMRSKSYTPEKKDLETVKDILMQLYKKLTQY